MNMKEALLPQCNISLHLYLLHNPDSHLYEVPDHNVLSARVSANPVNVTSNTLKTQLFSYGKLSLIIRLK